MNRADFMKNLAELLADMSPSEREEAIQYYNDYFDDAGAENEQSVIASLGTPQQLARTIKAGLSGSEMVGEFTEKGFSGYEQKKSNEVLNPNQPQPETGDGGTWQQNSANGTWEQNSRAYQTAGSGRMENGSTGEYYRSGNGYQTYRDPYNGQNTYQDSYAGKDGASGKDGKKPKSAGSVILLIILCICASPIVLGIGGGILGGGLGVLGGLFGCIVGFGAAAVALIIVGICLFVYGIGLLFSVPLGGLCMMGAAMICMALGLFFAWIIVMICAKVIPALIRGVVRLIQNIFHKGGAAA